MFVSLSVMSDSFRPHRLQHARLPCPSLFPGICSDSCSLSWWCHPTNLSPVAPSPRVLSLAQHQAFFQEAGSLYQVACIGTSASLLPVTVQDWFPLGLTSLISREGNGTPLQYSCLENSMDGGAWWAAVHGVAEGQTRLSDFTFPFHFHALEKEMATHSIVLAWRIPGTGEPGGLPSMGSHRVGHDWSNLAATASVFKYTLVRMFRITLFIRMKNWGKLKYPSQQNVHKQIVVLPLNVILYSLRMNK